VGNEVGETICPVLLRGRANGYYLYYDYYDAMNQLFGAMDLLENYKEMVDSERKRVCRDEATVEIGSGNDKGFRSERL
jgi:hypothetical protein